jgi:hypothetical protein
MFSCFNKMKQPNMREIRKIVVTRRTVTTAEMVMAEERLEIRQTFELAENIQEASGVDSPPVRPPSSVPIYCNLAANVIFLFRAIWDVLIHLIM